ncbi:MAG: mobile mystery protein B [Actinomycetia bacterium]|nr:mobile mystery protein B [Actinomycetes bacterium]
MGPLTDGDDDANTPVTEADVQGLIPSWVATRADLNDVEATNVARGYDWIFANRFSIADITDIAFVQELHRQMFGDVWEWAGVFRTTDLNIGIRWFEITEAVKQLVDNAALRFETPGDTDAECVDLHHQMVRIHPFINGNGRHGRAIADAAAVALGQAPFSWGSGSIVTLQDTRTTYIAALRRADQGDLAPLNEFARS